MRVVLEHAVPDRPTVLPGSAEGAVRAEQPADDRLGRPARGGEVAPRGRVVDAGEGDRRVGEGADGQPVPRRQGLAVARRLGPRRASLEQASPGLGEPAGHLVDRPLEDGRELVVGRDPGQDRHPFPVALVGHAVRGGEEIGGVAQYLPDLGGAPGEGQALDPVGVGVLARGERAVLGRQLAQHVVEGGPGDVAVARVSGEAPGVDVDPGQLGVVVEHLLEVRHEPLGVGRVAVEPAAELVPHPAIRHRVQRASRHHERSRIPGRGGPAQLVLDGHRLRELRRAAPAAVGPVEGRLDGRRRGVEEIGRGIVRSGLDPALGDQARHQPPARRLDLVTPLTPRPVDTLEHLAERGHAVAGLVREVRAAVERPAVRGQEDRHRPAPAAGHRLDGRHVDLIEVGPFLAIDLDRDEVIVEIPRRRLVLEDSRSIT